MAPEQPQPPTDSAQPAGDSARHADPAHERPPAVRVEHLTAAYEGQTVLDDLSFEIGQSEVLVILGGSGSGKSTLLKHIIGLYEPAAGAIWIGDEDIVQARGTERDLLLRKIGVMYQSGALFGSLTVLQNVGLPLQEFTDLPPDAIDVIARVKLQLVGLEHACDKMPSELSGGMIKRVAIARAMALDPSIIFLDEPSAGLDPITSRELDELILSLREALGLTFVIVTHELESVFKIADRVVMLDSRTKKIGAQGPPKVLARESEDPWVKSFLGGGHEITETT